MTKTQAASIQIHVDDAIAALSKARGASIVADASDEDAEIIGDSLEEALQAAEMAQERLNNVSGE